MEPLLKKLATQLAALPVTVALELPGGRRIGPANAALHLAFEDWSGLAKLAHICRKLMLQPGESFLDIGAGWGGLLLWAAEHYGVTATGITLSQNQHAYVNALIEQKGLQSRVKMLLLDYRDLPEDIPYD